MEELQTHILNQKDDDGDDERGGSVIRRRTTPASHRRTHAHAHAHAHTHRRNTLLHLRCVLIRNLPKGFVGRSDLTDKNTPISVRRIVYCEESNGSIMVEFASAAERNKILAMDQQRRRRIRQRIPGRPQQEGAAIASSNNGSNSNNNSNSNNTAFEISVTVERCTSERFVRTVLFGVSSSHVRSGTPRSDYQDHDSEPSPLMMGVFPNSNSNSAAPSSSRLVRRCIVIRKCALPENVEEDPEIPEAPFFEKRVRSDDASIRSGDSSLQQQQQYRHKPSPMGIRSGNNIYEVVVRGVTLRNKSKMTPAMVVELESEESVERILLEEDAKQSIENAPPTTLVIPVVLHAVKSERYAKNCFGGNTRAYPQTNERKFRSNNTGYGSNTFAENENGGGDGGEYSRVTEIDETVNNSENGDCRTSLESEEENNGEGIDTNVLVTPSQEQQLKNMEKEIRDTRSEMGRWKARALASKRELSLYNKSSSNDEIGGMIAAPNDHKNSQNPAPSAQSQIQSGASEESNKYQEWLEECRKVLEERVQNLSAENDRLKLAGAAESPLQDSNKAPDSPRQQREDVVTENDKIESLESELEESGARQKQAEQARNKLEEENSGLLRYVLELEGHRSGQALAEEERNKELEKKHSDLSTLYRFVQAQAEQSAKDLRKAVEEKKSIEAEFREFKSAWQIRMDTQRRLEKSKDDKKVCIDCETVKFHTLLEQSKNDGKSDLKNGHSVCESEATTTTTTPITNGVLPEHDQTTG